MNSIASWHKALIGKYEKGIATTVAVLSLLVAVLTFFSVLNKDFGFLALNRAAVYAVYALMLVFSLITSERIRYNWILIAFCGVSLISILVNSIDAERFSPWGHLALFVVALSLFSPMLESDVLKKVHIATWHWLMVAMRVIVVLSLGYGFYWYTHVYGRVEVVGEYNIYISNLAYTGIVNHGMLFSFICALVAADALWRLIFKDLGRRQIVMFVLLLLISVLGMVCGASRCSLLGFFFSVVLLMAMARWTRRKALLSLLFIVVAGGILAAAPRDFFAGLEKKISFSKEKKSLTISRDELWEARILEFKDSPIFGIGFANATHFSERFDDFDTTRGRFMGSEPASCWLSVLSNTGILGALLMLWFNITIISKGIVGLRRRNKEIVYFSSIYTLMVVNGTFEGWMLYGGALHSVMFWLTTSRINEITGRHEDFDNYSNI